MDIHEFRQRMSVLHEAHNNDKTVVLVGNSLKEVLQQASIELQLPERRLAYEILEEKHSFLDKILGKTKWKVLVFSSPDYVKGKKKETDLVEQKIEIVSNADFGLRLSVDGNIYFRALPPEGNEALSIDLEKVMEQAKGLKVSNIINTELVEQIITDSDREWHSVGTFNYDSGHACQLSVTISEDAMKATLVMTTQGGGGATSTVQEIKDVLLKNGSFFGTKEDVLENIESHPVFRVPIVVAEGKDPEHGKDTRLQSFFDTSDTFNTDIQQEGNTRQGVGGELYTNNVEAGQIVAEILPPSQGIPGRTVRGDLIPARDGNYQELPIGDNVELSDDGTQLIAKTDGRVVFINDRLCVESVLVINGDVKSYIDFLGTVVISGNVEDGYDINAKGNIHIDGTVGRSRITSFGDIYVGGGINGDKDSAIIGEEHQVFIKCGGSIWAKFIQNCYLEAEGFVVVSDGILNSEILALKKVLCRGRRLGGGFDNRRAAIMGGRVRACEEIHAVNLGSASGTPTRIEVGLNPRIQDEYLELSKKLDLKKQGLEDLEKSIDNWKKSGKIRPLTPEKQNRFNDILSNYDVLKREVTEETAVVDEKRYLLKNSVTFARISASSRVCVGVSMSINSAEYTVTDEYNRPVSFIEQDGLVLATDYENNRDDLKKEEVPAPARSQQKIGSSRRNKER